MTQAKQEALIIHEEFDTPKGKLILEVNFSTINDDIEGYQDRLMAGRSIPYESEDMSPSDPMVFYASQNLPHITDPNEVMREVRAHYRALSRTARNHAGIIAATKLSPKFNFEPEPYPVSNPDQEWDIKLPEPAFDFNRPLEKRLKQVLDTLSSDVMVAANFYRVLDAIFVTAERMARDVEKESGFPPDGSSDNVSTENVAASVVAPQSDESSGVGGIFAGNGDFVPPNNG